MSGCGQPYDQLLYNDCHLSHFWGTSKQIPSVWLWILLLHSICLCPWGGPITHGFGAGHSESDWVIVLNKFALPLIRLLLSPLDLLFFLPQRCLSTLAAFLNLKGPKGNVHIMPKSHGEDGSQIYCLNPDVLEKRRIVLEIVPGQQVWTACCN